MAGNGVWVAVNASMKGFASTVLKESNSAAKQAGKAFEKEFSNSGKLAGAQLAKAVEQQTSKLATQRNVQAQATKQLKIAEQELENTRRNTSATAVQIAEAERKLEVSKAKLEDSNRRVAREEQSLQQLQETGIRSADGLAKSEDKLAQARIELADSSGRAKTLEAELEQKREAAERATEDLVRAEQQLDHARKTGDEKAIASAERAVETARKASDKANRDVAKTEGEVERARTRVQNATDQLTAKEKTHAAVVKDVESAKNSADGATKRWTQSLLGMDHPLSGITGKLGTMAGVVAGGLGLAGGIGFFGDAITQGMELDNVMGSLQAVTGSTGETMEVVSQKARQLGMDESLAGTSAASATDAMLALAKGGMSVSDAMEAAKGSIQLAGAAQIDAGQAADIQIAALNSFGLAASEAGRVADVLTNTANSSATGITELAESLKYAAPVASTLGISLEDTNTMLGLFANNGVKGSEAGTAFRSSLLSLTAPSKEAAKALEEMGVNAFDAENKFVGLANLSDQLKDAHERMGDAAFTAAAATAFGREAVGFATTAAKGGSEAFNELRSAMDRQGSAAETAGAKLAGMNGAMDRFNNAMDDLKLRIYEVVAPHLTEWLDSASASVTSLGDAFASAAGFMERHPDIMKTIAGAATGVIAGFAAIKAAQAGLWVTSFAKEFVATLRLMPALLTAQAAGTGTATAAQHGLNAAMRANPIGFIITIISALVGALIWFFTETETGQKIWKAFMDALKAGANWLKDKLAPVWDVIVKAWDTAWSWIKDKVGELKQVFEGLYNLVFNGDYDGNWYDVLGIEEDSWIVNYILDVRNALVGLYNLVFNGDYDGNWYDVLGIEEDSWIVNHILDIRNAVLDFADKMTSAWNTAKDAWNDFTDAFDTKEDALKSLKDLIGDENVQRLIDFGKIVQEVLRNVVFGIREFQSLFNDERTSTANIKSLFGEDAEEVIFIAQALGHGFRGMQIVAQEVFPYVGQLIQGFGLVVKGVFEGQIAIAMTAVQLLWLNITTAFQIGVITITGAFTQLGITLQTIWETIKNVVFLTFSQAIDNLVTTFQVMGHILRGDWQAVHDTLTQYYQRMKDRVFDAFKNQLDIFKDYFRRTTQNVKESVNDLMGVVQEIPGKIQRIFSNAGRWLYDAGRRIIQGLIDGIRAMGGALTAAFDATVGIANGNISTGGSSRSRGGVSTNAGQFADGGRIPAFVTGGRLPSTGPGTEIVDGFVGVDERGIPIARVSREEWVINAHSSEKYNKELAMINAGTFPKLPGYVTGGRIGASSEELLGLVRGSHSQPLHGSPYVWGGVKWGDCSATVSAVANFAAGRAPFASRFATSNEAGELAARGFRRGKGGRGDLRVGFRNGGPGGGHTSGTLPDGTNFEMGGGHGGNGKVGPLAAGAWDSYYTDFFHLPVVDSAAIAAEAAQAAKDSAAIHATALTEGINISEVSNTVTKHTDEVIRQEPAFDPTKAAPMSPENALKYGMEVANKVFWEEIGEGGIEKLIGDQILASTGLNNSIAKKVVDKATEPAQLPSWYGATHPDNPATNVAKTHAEMLDTQAQQELSPEEREKDKQLRGGVYDTGGVLKSGHAAVNLSGKPEYVLNPKDTESLLNGNAGKGVTVVVNVDGDEVLRKRVEVAEENITINTKDLKEIKNKRRDPKTGTVLLS